ncbi:large-conductance mechanosensitive channel [Campylobacter sputorum subsp. bubulus]|uniref:Large-conductance mechanosensitive channel n=1 Tax=Campylobacter sputorum subsp. sputorum TaxID=32024 RepID=A0A381DJ33_9BACT|nr:large-conductance mechanosensitive channel protein MscL [Campylobacter sputorum]ASM35675.1 large conductance mechanosensitive channel protein [Campylobacter sputorum aubsp. sputorum RM3237]KAB0582595.1 large-conductance mechanosensitive channel protein MscL [Campylobacter sputorum subsp. sputorum]QEL05867.1 large conductance mechanosensitive channel protein [Campylobacter sputorum subsp. sputorum]SUX07907.1 large-conductance mechanosensitive channel [Campylobacter sputorum subsp. bubulus]SU
MSFIKEFKEFAMKGNVVDMAVGVVIGAAFGKIVSSLVSDVIMPVMGILTGGVNFSHMNIVLKEAVGTAPAVTLNYGSFIQTIIDFLIIAFAIFIAIKAMNKIRKQDEKKENTQPAPKEDIVLLTEIRDLLKK